MISYVTLIQLLIRYILPKIKIEYNSLDHIEYNSLDHSFISMY